MNKTATSKLDLPIKSFKSAVAFEKWLAKNHSKSPGIWLKFFKKNSGIKSVYYDEALDIALCYGWIAAAKRDGRWKVAYESPRKMQIPSDFLKELARDPKAHAFFQTLNKRNLYAIAWRLNTAYKPAIRENRMKKILQMLASGKKLH